jgi:hypothetical protein
MDIIKRENIDQEKGLKNYSTKNSSFIQFQA